MFLESIRHAALHAVEQPAPPRLVLRTVRCLGGLRQGAHQKGNATFTEACLLNTISFGFLYDDFQNDWLTFR